MNAKCVNCNDCTNLSPRDVFRGVCVLSKDDVQLNNPACGSFKPVSKCKFCKKYVPSADKVNLGTCDGVMVYPDLTGCEDFVSTE